MEGVGAEMAVQGGSPDHVWSADRGVGCVESVCTHMCMLAHSRTEEKIIVGAQTSEPQRLALKARRKYPGSVPSQACLPQAKRDDI